jgi:hypothetical protein
MLAAEHVNQLIHAIESRQSPNQQEGRAVSCAFSISSNFS